MILLCLITFFTAFILSYINLFNNKKISRFFFLIWRNGMVIFYCSIYGLIGVLLFLFLKETAIEIDENATSLSAPAFKAFVVGLTTRGMADISFFNIKHQGEPFPVGLRSITQFLDTRFDKEFNSICLDKLIKFIKAYKIKYANTNFILFKNHVSEILAVHPAKEKATTFTTNLEEAASAKEILDRVLKEFGKRTLETVSDGWVDCHSDQDLKKQ